MKRYKMSDVVIEINERENNPSTSKYDRFVGLEHYVSGDVIIRNYGSTNLLESSMKVFKSGDILVARRNVYLKRASMVDFEGLTSGDSIVLRAKNPTIGRILPFILNTDDFWDFADQFSDGTMSKRLSPKTLMKYEFVLPEDNELENLADLLWAMNDSKEAYQHLLIHTDELVKSQFIEMFGEPETNDCGWNIETLKDVCIGKLSYGSGAAAVDYDAETRYVRITDITEEGDLGNDIKSPNAIDEKYLLNEGDILFARSGATVGKTFRYQAKYGRCIYAGFLIRLIPDSNKVIPEYVFGFTKSAYYEEFVKKTQRAVGQPNINAQEYGDLKICVPPLEHQRQFAEIVKQTDKSKYTRRFGVYSSMKGGERCA